LPGGEFETIDLGVLLDWEVVTAYSLQHLSQVEVDDVHILNEEELVVRASTTVDIEFDLDSEGYRWLEVTDEPVHSFALALYLVVDRSGRELRSMEWQLGDVILSDEPD
jgi:hypothetical protein